MTARVVRQTRWLVVGGGAAGCVVAARLSESPTNTVTLIEAGPEHSRSAGQPGAPVLDHVDRLVPGLRIVRRPGAESQPYAAGFGLGGSSLVNPGVVVGSPRALDHTHALPVAEVAASDIGPVGTAVLTVTADAAPVSLSGRDGQRVSVAEAYLTPAVRRRVSIVAGSPVRTLAFDGRRVVGVFTADGSLHEGDRVVLCAGAIGTPTILLRSNVDTPGVGERLQDHAGVAIAFDVARSAPSSSPTIAVTVERPDRQIVVLERLADDPAMGAVIAGRLAIASEGRVSLPNPAGPPLVELDQLGDERDLDGLVEVVEETIGLLRTAPVAQAVGECYIDGAGTPLSAIEGDEAAIRRWIPDHLGGYHHVAGSCRRGTVVDDHGCLVGYDGVFLADASVLPGVPRRNPYLTVIRHAEVAARNWRDHPPSGPSGPSAAD